MRDAADSAPAARAADRASGAADAIALAGAVAFGIAVIRAVLVAALLICTIGAVPAEQQWVLINDIHLDPFDRSSVAEPGEDTNVALWDTVLAELRRRPQPSVVVLGGDFLAHHFSDLARQNGQNPERAALQTMRTIAHSLGQTFPKAQFVVALGNNDDPCGDYRSETGGAYQRQLTRIWEPLVNRGGAAPDFAMEFYHGGYYTAQLPAAHERAVVLNSVLWSFVYSGGCASSTRAAGARELAWLSATLQHVPRAVLVMHMPPGYDPSSTTKAHRLLAVPFLSGAANRQFLGILTHNAARVPFALAAHTHRYDFRIAGGVPLLIGSAVSPVYNNNPAFYELHVDAGGALHDIVPVFYDQDEDVWREGVSFDRMYAVDSFSAANLARIAARIADQPDVRSAWMAAYDVWTDRMNDVSDHSWSVFSCAQTQLGSGYASCAGTQRRTQWAIGALAVAALAAVALVVVLIRVRLSLRRL
ncbi:MAG TPA: metallophosphoesterase [Candidatus Baltobacteraceae bacterium]|jgi:hypothetical protein|nr:metallophosphoesterase [Candidatus Baltobacteraceae bacterium]